MSEWELGPIESIRLIDSKGNTMIDWTPFLNYTKNVEGKTK